MVDRAPDEHDAGSLEDALVEALTAYDDEGAAGLERVLAAHPQHRAGMLEQLSRLRGYGLLRDATEMKVPAAEPRDFPERLGEFRLLERLGRGGMGVVYLAEQASLGRRVALKLIRAEHLYFGGAHERFRREVEAIAKLQHPGIVPVFAAGEEQGVPWLAMEHVVGASLDEVLRQLAGRDPARLLNRDLVDAVRTIVATRGAAPPPLPSSATPPPAADWVDTCLRVTHAIVVALQHAHERGVLHRDVKPSNVMLTLDGRVLLLDFGLALSDGATRLTGTGHPLGTPAYMSPEQMRGDARRVDARTDVYSSGVLLYELLTLRQPFVGDSAESTRAAVLDGRYPPPRLLHRSIPRDVEIVCKKAMDVDAGRRYATVAAFAEDLDRLLTRRPILARSPTALRIAQRWVQRHPARATALAAAFLLLFVAPIVFLLQQQAADARLFQEQQAASARLLAEQQAANARILAALGNARVQRDRALEAVKTMLTRVAAEELSDVPRMQHVRRDLFDAARAFHERFLAEAAGDPELARETAESALQVAYLDHELGRVEAARTATTRALELTRQLLAASPDEPAHHKLLCDALTAAAGSAQSTGRLEEAHSLLIEAKAAGERALALEPDDPEAVVLLMGAAMHRGLVCRQTRRSDDALAAYHSVRTLWDAHEEKLRNSGQIELALSRLVGASADEATLLVELGRVGAAADPIVYLEELAAEHDLASLPSSAQLGRVRLLLLRARLAGDDADAAERLLQQAQQVVDGVLAMQPDHANALRCQAMIANAAGQLRAEDPAHRDAQIRSFELSIATLRRLIAVDPGFVENRANLAGTLCNLGATYLYVEPAKARPLFEEAVATIAAARQAAPERAEWAATAHVASWFLGQACGLLGDHRATAAAAEALVALRPEDPRTLRIAGGLHAEALRGLATDRAVAEPERAALRAKLGARAMELLRAAGERGCADAEWLDTGPDSATLRELDGFDAILRKFAANAARK